MNEENNLFVGRFDNSDETMLALLKNAVERVNVGLQWLRDENEKLAWFQIGQGMTGLTFAIEILEGRKGEDDE